MLSDALQKKLNAQLQYEFFAESQYRAISAYFFSKKLNGFANFFLLQTGEEHQHGLKFFQFINDNGGRVTIPSVKEPKNEFGSVIEPVEIALKYEREGTDRLYDLMNDALAAREHATVSFLKWFIDAQVQEVSTLENLAGKLKMIGGEGGGLYMLNKELGAGAV